MSRFGEMFVEWAAFCAMDVVPVAVESYVSGWLAFSYILAVFTKGAMPQIYCISAFAVKVVFDSELFIGLVAYEGFAGNHDSATFVFRCAEASSAAGDFPGFLGGDDLFPLRDMYLA